MRTAVTAACVLALCVSLPLVGASRDQPPKLTDDELRAEAVECARWLYGFGFMQRAWFEEGLEKAEKTDITGGGVRWPPPTSYSWRVAVLPAIEQAPLYQQIWKASDEFKIDGNLPAAELRKHAKLNDAFVQMPEWMKLGRWRTIEGKTIYRRLVVPDKPAVFIVVESAELVPWYNADDDLILDPKKPLPKVGGHFPSGFFALCGDGKVRYLPKTLTEKQVHEALLTGKGVPAIRAGESNERKQDIESLDLKGK